MRKSVEMLSYFEIPPDDLVGQLNPMTGGLHGAAGLSRAHWGVGKYLQQISLSLNGPEEAAVAIIHPFISSR